MIRDSGVDGVRPLKSVDLATDLAVVGGGLAGTCAAITAARAGIHVVLVQDRPVLGGNASSEVRLWILGASSHMGNNNRWAREGGVVDEILVENLYRNPEGNPLILDTILLETVRAEPNIRLLLNTAVDTVEKSDTGTISRLSAYCSQNQTRYRVEAPLYCDASGDGIVAFLAGAPFRMGAEKREEFGEGMAPSVEYGELLGHSLYFYSKDVGCPVRFVPPAFALRDITEIPRYRDIRAHDTGCRFWWFEWGGRRDTVYDTEEIKWELWRVAYGVWDYIKNSGRFPEAQNLTLEWVGTIPGKRESRRFEGDYILTQHDVVEQRTHPDAVSYGGWAIDLHPSDGVYSELPSCSQWHSKGVYQIPYRCYYSRGVSNLFLAGRIISVSHVAFGSTRVMATCGHGGQAVGMAAALCCRKNVAPRDLLESSRMAELQRELLCAGQYIPGMALHDPADLACEASVSASSRFVLDELADDGGTVALNASRAMLLPVAPGPLPSISFRVDVREQTTLQVEVRGSSVEGNYTPDVTLFSRQLLLEPGPGREISIRPDARTVKPGYFAYCLLQNPVVSVHTSSMRVTGILSLSQTMNAAVAKGARQDPPQGTGIESFEFWLPARRPNGKNFALTVNPPLDLFGPENISNGLARPTRLPNAWVAAVDDRAPRLTLRWSEARQISRVVLGFDTDFDHPMESVLMGHPERAVPFCVKRYRILDHRENLLFESHENHQTRNTVNLETQCLTDALHIDVIETYGAPAAIFEVRVYGQ
ncbi:MAG: FAD-dependent oxidoreductase [Terriglobia bacterium]|jgi:hypothetical protein